MKKLYSLALTLCLALGVLAGCGTSSVQEGTGATQEEAKQEISATITLSQNNGEEKMANEEVTVEQGTTLLEAMENTFEVDVSEGFINGIEGISMDEEKKMAWTYTINGEEAMVGAGEYELEQGDDIVFDYHSWE
ncbi:DUF4430 domain-containing protein [Halobacillus locisalis]|uniref:DUF4430 domain-containing protein n=1 Tax=Halobacillus locisalis TaxID=220753 RepID=A0A838CPG8_9BACI|nr:DUF4430 domain-containing protein [Halobacillus locisalis]MBA2173831.1 DUF4430 domain-containing protein [Halobacillus locisalis]